MTKIKIAFSLAVSLVLFGCGGADETATQNAPQDTQEQSQQDSQGAVQLPASSLNLVPFSYQPKVKGASLSASQIIEAGQLNAVGGFNYPQPNSQFDGNLTLAIDVSDAQGINNIYLGSSGSEFGISVCDISCGAEFKATISGINPTTLGWLPGQNTLELWVVDGNEDQQRVATLVLFWQPKIITNVVAEITEASSQLNISWTTSDEFLWYNVYVANEPGITGNNIASLIGGVAELGIRENSVSLSQKPIDQDYYLVVSGVDGTGESAFSSEIVLVNGLDFTPPMANYDEFTVAEEVQLTGNLIANDTSTGTNTITIVTSPISDVSHGRLEIFANGTFEYTPDLDFFGIDQFSYQIVSSNGLSSIALVRISVLSINDAPVSNVDSFIISDANLTVSAPGLLENDFDVESDALTVNLPLVKEPLFGSISVSSNGSFVYTPNESFTTFDQFIYQTTDGIDLSAETLVTIQSPDFNGFPPFAIADSYQVDEDTLLTVSVENGVLANDSDNDHELAELVLSIVTTTMHGELVLATDGSFSYQPTDNFTGTDSFSYQLSDPDGNQTIAVAQINVQPKNDPPVANNDVYVVSNASVVTIPSGLGILTNDSDIDGDQVFIDVASVTTAGSGSVVVNVNGSFVYTPQAEFIGVDSFSYRVTDGNLVSGIATVQLNVVAAHAATDDLTPIVVDIFEILGDLPSNVEITSAVADVGNAVLSDGQITFTPAVGQAGISIITLQLLIESQVNNYQIVVLVTTNNSNPIITSAASVVIAENLVEGTEIFTVTATDADQDPLTYFIDDVSGTFEINSNTGVISVKNNALIDFESSESFEFTISVFDIFDAVGTQTFTVSVSDVDEAPVLTSATDFELLENTEEGTLVYQATGFDPEAQTVTYALNGSASGLTIDVNGEIRVGTDALLDFETAPNFELELVLSDGNLSQIYVIDVRVLNVNEPPVVNSASQFSLDENTPNQSEAGYTATISADPEGNSVLWSISEDELQIFGIDSVTGVLVVENNTELDFETTETYDIVITATETNGSPSNLSTSLTVTVNILDVLDDVDTDEDGLTDSQEAVLGTNINNPDTDEDGLLDGEEVEIGTDPLDEDSDDDLILDGDEVAADTDPLNPDITPPNVIFVSPYDLQTNVCTNQGITVRFDEPIRASSVNELSVQLQHENDGLVPGLATAVSNNREIFFRATDALATDSNFTVVVTGVKDSAGNAITGSFSSAFSTGTCVESDRPRVAKVSPWDDAVNIPRNTQIAVIIDEKIDPTTLTPENFYVVDSKTLTRVPSQLSLSQDNTVMRLVADEPLSAGQVFIVYLTSGITDVYGNQLFSFQFNFRTGFVEDSMSPVVKVTSSQNGDIDLPINSRFSVLFDSPIDASQLANIELLNSEGQQVDATVSVEHDRSRIILQPTIELTTGSDYQFVVDNVSDLAGNKLQEPIELNVTTGQSADTESGSILRWSIPSSNASELPLNPTIEVVLSKPVDPTTIVPASFYLYENNVNQIVKSSQSISDDLTTIRLELESLLTPEQSYYIYVGDVVPLTDIAGNIITDGSSRYFTTGLAEFSTKPQIVATNVASGSLTMPINPQFTFQVDRKLSENCALDQAATLTVGEEVVPFSITLAASGLEFTIESDEPLMPNTSYQLELDQVCDYAGNIIDKQTITFTTSSDTNTDTTGPSLVNITPLNQAVDVSTDTSIVLEFNEDVSLMAKPKILLDISGTDLEVPGDYEVVGNIITFTPSEPLLGSNRYRIEIYHYVPDLAGNTANGGTKYFNTVSETDITPPEVTLVSPENGAIGVSPDNTEIVLSFSEPITQSTLNNDNIALYAEGEVVLPSVYRGANGKEVTLIASLPADTIVSIIVSNKVLDLSGNPLEHFISSFTTGAVSNDYSRPSLIQESPENGVSDVTERHNIYFYFNQKLDASTLNDGVTVIENGQPIEVEVSLLEDGKTIHVYYADGFALGADVTTFLDDSIKDLSGNRIYEASTYFTLAYLDGRVGFEPYVTGYSPQGYYEGVPLNSSLMVQFNEPMATSTFDEQTVILYELDNDFENELGDDTSGFWEPISYTSEWDETGRLLTIIPSALLEVNKSYYLSIDSSVEDTDGDPLNYSFSNYIYTDSDSIVDDRQPMITAFSPSMGTVGVGTNATFTVEFDESINSLTFSRQGQANIQFDSDNKQLRYSYYQPLPALMEHTETISDIYDFSGNRVVSGSTTFTTAEGSDFTSPMVIDSTFVDYDVIPRDAILTVTFNEPIDPSSAHAGSVYLYDGITGDNIEATVEVSPDGRKITLIPTDLLPAYRRLYFYLYGLHDLSHNVLSYVYYRLDSDRSVTEQPFIVTATTVENNATLVPRNVKLNVRFNQSLTTDFEQFISLIDEQGNPVEHEIVVGRERKLITLLPKMLLNANAQYTWSVGLVQNSAGQTLSMPTTIRFTTGELTDIHSGSIATWGMPPNGADNIPRNPQLSVTFDEAIDPTTIDDDSFYLYDTRTGITIEGERLLSSENKTVSFVANETLRGGVRHYFYVGYSPYLTDLAGNRVGSSSYRYFDISYEEDDVAPNVLATNIISNATNLPINGTIELTFDEPLNRGCLLDGGVKVEENGVAIDIELTLSSDETTLSIVPVGELTAASNYILTVSNVCDYAGNENQSYQLEFSTLSDTEEDTTAPSLVSTFPAHQATEITTSLSAITMEFDEDIDQRVAPEVRGGGITVPGAYQVTGNTVVFTPSVNLVGNTSYNIYLYSTVADLAGNTRNLGTRQFTTAASTETTAPTVVAISPANLSLDTNPESNIVLTFSEPMAVEQLTSSNIAVFSGADTLIASISRSLDGHLVTLNTNLPENSLISVVINDQVMDLNGNRLVPFVSSFTTGLNPIGTDRPSVVQQIPTYSNTTLYDIDAVSLYLSKPISSANLANGVTVLEDGKVVDVDVSLSASGSTLTATKDGGFTPGSRIEIYVEGLTDLVGNLIYSYDGYFEMAEVSDFVGVAPSIVSRYPNNSVGLPLNLKLMAKFSEPLDETTVKSENIIFYKSTTEDVVQSATVELDPSGTIVSIVPDEPLEPDTYYYVQFTPDIIDTDGDAHYGYNYISFSTGELSIIDDVSPMIVAMNPPDGSENIGVNALFSVRYDESINPISFMINNSTTTDVMFDETDKVITYRYKQSLASNSEITEIVSGVTDGAGNVAATSQTVFNTADSADVIAPSVVDVSITYNQINVPINGVIQWQFSEPIDPTSLSSEGIYYWNSTDLRIAATWELSSGGTILTVTPTTALRNDTLHYAYAYGLRDLSGNSVSNEYRYFTTNSIVDVTAPTVLSTNISHEQTGLPLNVKLRVRIDEAITRFNTDVANLTDSEGLGIPLSVSLTRERTLLTLTPKRLLDADETYTFTLSGVYDLSQNASQDNISLTFTTGNKVDTQPSGVNIWSIPVNYTVDVPLNPLLQVTFDEPVDITTIDNDTFYLLNTDSQEKVPSTWELTNNDKTLTLLPDSALAANTRHDFYVGYSPYLLDNSGNILAQSQRRIFTTSDTLDPTAPILMATNLPDGHTDMPINGMVVLEFDAPLSDSCPMDTGVKLSTDSGAINTEVTLATDRKTITIQGQENLSINTTYYVSVNALCDYAGNQYAETDIVSFTTSQSDVIDSIAPSVVSITPANNALDVDVNTVITIVFDESIDIRSTPEIKQGSEVVEGVYDVSGDTIVFTPNAALLESTTYTINIFSSSRDMAGNVRNRGSQSFTTGSSTN